MSIVVFLAMKFYFGEKIKDATGAPGAMLVAT
jgi:hypothetical protein